ncbi:carboxypeptidase-like regulatory domain-containing protein [Poritiphilus flavus]|uniref:Carboxypeptidase-like regulatory domain-containing protein n=1 Tax=Poritiphilus flavus TaxID=2697053 RepID=A0A6L9EBD9_9FLAO|nr:carboxypeptidase-like regulatory domain-containing protein [Poritiphilus flavus]NAS11994.1 carboxypeptidase-like regulatory domain-containing protein [Poritiphilus flavus]
MRIIQLIRTGKGLTGLAFGLILAIFVAIPSNSWAFQEDQDQQEVSFNQYKGEVVDASNKKPLIFASLTLEGTNISTVTNTEGEFLLKVPKSTTEGNIAVSFLGYKTRLLPLSQLKDNNNRIALEVSITELTEVDVTVPRDAVTLVKETLRKKGENYFDDPTLMTAFYRETIKKRRRNVSLSEAVVNIYKTPYTSKKRDAVQLFKARKSTDYNKLDTLALKLQGGPFNALFVDIMKYPEFIFTPETLDYYDFNFDRSTRINDQLIFVINFKQRPNILEPLYEGKLYIDAQKKILTSAIYSLNIVDKVKASRMFVRKKPKNARVYPTEVAYRVDYREKDGKWYYGYSNVLLEFKVNWDRRLFNSVYSMTCEMAITDWEKNLAGEFPKSKERIKSSIILSEEAIGFSDPDFWGEYNIIEPEKSIESAIRKIQRQLRRSKTSGGESAP